MRRTTDLSNRILYSLKVHFKKRKKTIITLEIYVLLKIFLFALLKLEDDAIKTETQKHFPAKRFRK